MADRYWVGGSGTWNATNTANWSETSGGAGGASAPTADDDVFFDGNSDTGANFTVTLATGAVCRDFNANTNVPLDRVMTLAGTGTWDIYGSFYFPTTNISRTHNCTIRFLSSRKGNIIVTNGITMSSSGYQDKIRFENVNGEWTLGSSFNSGTNINIVAGTLNTGNYAVDYTGGFEFTGSQPKILNAGSSQIGAAGGGGGGFYNRGTSVTLNPGTSTIYNLREDIKGLVFYNAGTSGFFGGFTATNFIVTNNYISGALTDTLGNCTIHNLIVNRNTDSRSCIVGTGNKIIKITGSVTINYADFFDITLDGPNAPYTGNVIGNYGKVNGINFPAPKTVYWASNTTGDYRQNVYSLTPTGAASVLNTPVVGDTLVFTDQRVASGGSINFNDGRGTRGFNLDLSQRTLPITLTGGAQMMVGNTVLSPAVTINNTSGLGFNTPGNVVFDPNGATISTPITIGSSSWSVPPAGIISKLDIQNNLTTSSSTTLTAGTLDLNGYNLTTASFSSSNSNLRKLTMGSSTMTLTGSGTVWETSTFTNGRFESNDDAVIALTSASAKTINGGGITFPIVSQDGAGTLTINGNNAFINLRNTVQPTTILFGNNSTSYFKQFGVAGTSGNLVTLNRVSSGVFTFVSGSPLVADYVSVSNSTAFNGGWYATNSTDGGGNTNWVFNQSPPAARTLYWVGGTGTWNTTSNTNWSLSSGGPGGESPPTLQDDVVFDENSNPTAYTLTIGTSAVCKNITILPLTSGNITIAGSSLWTIYGSLNYMTSNITRTFTGSIALRGVGNHDINTGGIIMTTNTFDIESMGGKYTCQSAFIPHNSNNVRFGIRSGHFDTNGYTVTAGRFSIIDNRYKKIEFKNSTLIPTGSFQPWEANLNNTDLDAGTSVIDFVSSFYSPCFSGTGGFSYNELRWSPTTTAGVATPFLSIDSNNFWKKINIFAIIGQDDGKRIAFNANQTIETLSVQGQNPARTGVYSGSTVRRTLNVNQIEGTITDVDFYNIDLKTPSGSITGIRLGDCGNNLGIIFDPPQELYWNLPTGESLFGNGWTNTDSATPNYIYFPKPQDIAIFTDTGLNAGVTIRYGDNIPPRLGTIDFSRVTKSFNFNFPLDGGAGASREIYGNLILNNTINFTGNTTSTWRFRGCNKTQKIITNGKQFPYNIEINTINADVMLQDDLLMTNALTHTQGNIVLNGKNLTTTTFTSNNSNIRTLNFGANGKLTITGSGTAFNAATATNLTVIGQGTISMDSASAKTFAGGSAFYPVTLEQSGTGNLTITGNNYFKRIRNSLQPTTVTFTSGSTQTVKHFNLSGTANNLVTIQPSSTTNYSLINASGTDQILRFVNISRLTGVN